MLNTIDQKISDNLAKLQSSNSIDDRNGYLIHGRIKRNESIVLYVCHLWLLSEANKFKLIDLIPKKLKSIHIDNLIKAFRRKSLKENIDFVNGIIETKSLIVGDTCSRFKAENKILKKLLQECRKPIVNVKPHIKIITDSAASKLDSKDVKIILNET